MNESPAFLTQIINLPIKKGENMADIINIEEPKADEQLEEYIRKIHRLTPDLKEAMKTEKEYFKVNQVFLFNKAFESYKEFLDWAEQLEYGVIPAMLENNREKRIAEVKIEINKFLHPLYPPGSTKQTMAEIDNFCKMNIQRLNEELKKIENNFEVFRQSAEAFKRIIDDEQARFKQLHPPQAETNNISIN